MTSPDVSYIVSNYNSAEFLAGLLDDLLNRQSHQNIEVVVVDSASVDGSLVCLNEFKDDRLRYIVQDERTPYGVSWLEGWLLARGKVVGNSNTDDRSYPWRTTQVLNAFESDPVGHKFYYGGYETRQNNICIARGIPPQYSVDDMTQYFRCGVHVHWDSAISRMVDWDRMFKAGHEYKSAFDYWLVLYFMSFGFPGHPIPNCFSIYNQRPDSLEQSDKGLSSLESLRAIGDFFPDSPAYQGMLTNPDVRPQYEEFVRQFDV